MSLYRTDLAPLLTIVAGGIIGASLSFGFLGQSPRDVPAPDAVVAPSVTTELDHLPLVGGLFREVRTEQSHNELEEQKARARTLSISQTIAQQRLLERIERGKRAIEEYVEITPHYHFAAREFKAIGGSWFVARNVTLNFDDVPVFWLPFILQSTRVR